MVQVTIPKLKFITKVEMFKATAVVKMWRLFIYDIEIANLEIAVDSDASEKAGNISYTGDAKVIDVVKDAITGSGDQDGHIVNPEFASPRRFYQAWIFSRELKDSQLQLDETWNRTLTDSIPELPEGALS